MHQSTTYPDPFTQLMVAAPEFVSGDRLLNDVPAANRVLDVLSTTSAEQLGENIEVVFDLFRALPEMLSYRLQFSADADVLAGVPNADRRQLFWRIMTSALAHDRFARQLVQV